MIQLFNIQLNGQDAENFCKLSKEKKVEFIKKHSNQTDDFLIDELLKTSLKSTDCGCGCGGNKSGNGNISSNNADADSVAKQNNSSKGNGKRGANKGGKNTQSS